MIGFGSERQATVSLLVSLPVALLILAAWIGFAWLVLRAAWSRRGPDGEELRPSGSSLDGALAVVCVVLAMVTAFVPLALDLAVAVAYRRPRQDVMSWGDALGATLVLGSGVWVLAVLLVRLGIACSNGSTGARITAGLLGGAALLALFNVS